MTPPTLARATFGPSRAEALDTLHRLNLCDYVSRQGSSTPAIPREVRACKTYLDEWNYYRDRSCFDAVLSDLSLIQFTFLDQGVSYSYHGCPLEALSYREFVLQELGEDDPHGYVYATEYDIYLSQAPLRQNAITLRYDYAPDEYRPGVHPAGHLHIGYNSEIRLGCAWLMTPLAFVLQILRQLYPLAWESKCLTDERIRRLASRLRLEEHQLIDTQRMSTEEQLEYHLR